jgi:hypothetical protein
MSDSPATLEFIAEQQRRLLSEMADQRADMAVLLALTQRLDGTVSGLTNEVPAQHGQIGRLRARLVEVEANQG